MDRTYWHKQTADTPLFPDLVWSRPQNKSQAGKLLIIGGNLHGFAAPAESYQLAEKAGIGLARVLLPNALQKTVGRILEVGEYAPSNPSGSFSQQALAEFLDQAAWADGVLIAGDLGRNSETAILLEKFLDKYKGQVTITKDALEYVSANPDAIINRPKTTLVLSLSQLQRLLTAVKFTKAVKLSIPLLQLVEILHELTNDYAVNLITMQGDNLVVAVNGQVSTTLRPDIQKSWQITTASSASVWRLQNPTKAFESLTTAVYQTVR